MFSGKVNLFDIGIAAVVLLAAVLMLWIPFAQGTGEKLEITTPDATYIYDLSKDQTLSLESNGYTLQVVIFAGEARVSACNCPDGVCVASGRISKSGESILCAPAGVTLRVVGKGESDADFVAG